MKKNEFLKELRGRLSGLPQDEIDSRISFYSEMIDDRVEEGKTEEEAINDLGGTDEAVRQIVNDTKFVKLVKNKIKPKRSIGALEVVLLVLGFPLWLPLLIVFGVFMFVAFLLLWILVIVTYSVEAGILASSAMGFIKLLVEFMETGSVNMASLSIGLLGLGIGLIFLFICGAATKVSFRITKRILFGVKNRLVGGK